jgi:copper chaperone CopZ
VPERRPRRGRSRRRVSATPATGLRLRRDRFQVDRSCCIDCSADLGETLRRLPGVSAVEWSPSAGLVVVEHDGRVSNETVRREAGRAGIALQPADGGCENASRCAGQFGEAPDVARTDGDWLHHLRHRRGARWRRASVVGERPSPAPPKPRRQALRGSVRRNGIDSTAWPASWKRFASGWGAAGRRANHFCASEGVGCCELALCPELRPRPDTRRRHS